MTDPTSILLITLDSCRYDTFEHVRPPNLSAVGTLHRTMSPGNFTLSSHTAIFAGFTPGDAHSSLPLVNPKRGKFFRLAQGGRKGAAEDFVVLEGRSIVEGLGRLGYKTLGTGAVDWFNPATPASDSLIRDFDAFYHPDSGQNLGAQLRWIEEQLNQAKDTPVFLFLNIGETHVPYFHEGAPWPVTENPCRPFAEDNDRSLCESRQRACLSWVDTQLSDLLHRFEHANTIVCADHGDAWGEDGVWEHGVHHPKVLEVPLLFRLSQAPNTSSGSLDAIRDRARRLLGGNSPG